MNTWLRTILILVSVGGGFAGVLLTLSTLLHSTNGVMSYIQAGVFLGLFIFVTTSGILFALDVRRTRLLLISLAIQIPWISTPVIVYKFATGVYAALMLGNVTKAGRVGVRVWTETRLGSIFRFSWLSPVNPWGIGINCAALLLFLLLWRAILGSRPQRRLENLTNSLGTPDLETPDQ
jgi:hypothetical protein